MAKTKKRTTPKRSAPSSNHTDEQARALKALTLAAQFAKDLVPFKTAAGILTDDTAGEHDDVHNAIEDIAQKCFDAAKDGFDIEDVVEKAFALEHADPRIADLFHLHCQELHAHQLAGFALGVAWGRLQGGAR
jgi:hypothetical protein